MLKRIANPLPRNHKTTGVQISVEESNEAAFAQASQVVIGARIYTVLFNPPMVTALDLGSRYIVGCPLLPLVQCEHTARSPGQLYWAWERRAKEGSEWELVGDQQLYLPRESDLGCALRLTCQAGDPGPYVIYCNIRVRVEALPSPTAWEVRLGLLQRRLSLLPPSSAPLSLRVCSYNVLANAFATNDHGRLELCVQACHCFALS